jgi:hypothetical protein
MSRLRPARIAYAAIALILVAIGALFFMFLEESVAQTSCGVVTLTEMETETEAPCAAVKRVANGH